jgi:hypothetical protein
VDRRAKQVFGAVVGVHTISISDRV